MVEALGPRRRDLQPREKQVKARRAVVTATWPMPIRMKVYHQGKETLVAAADADLIGKTFREGKFKIEVGKFYEGDVVTEERFASELRLATIGNFVGKETIDAAKEAGVWREDGSSRANIRRHAPVGFRIVDVGAAPRDSAP